MRTFEEWLREHAVTARLDPAAPLSDLEPLREVVGDARVVAVGESAHQTREFYRLRHRLLRFLVERCGFTAFVFEAPFSDAHVVDEWVRGGAGTVEEVAAAGIAHGLGQCAEMYELLAWLRDHNAHAARPVEFAGCISGSPLPALRQVERHLREADPDALPLLDRAVGLARTYDDGRSTMRTIIDYAGVDHPVRDALTATLSRLLARLEVMGAHQRAGGRGREHAEALRHLRNAWYLDHFCRDMAGDGLSVGTANLDAFAAEAVLGMLARSPDARVVVATHNTHIRRTPIEHEGDFGLFPQGYHLARALGDAYVSIAVTSGGGTAARGEVAPEHPSGLTMRERPLPPAGADGVESAFTGDGPLVVADLRAARGHVRDAASFQGVRMEDYFMPVPVFDAFDAVAWVPEASCTDYVTVMDAVS